MSDDHRGGHQSFWWSLLSHSVSLVLTVAATTLAAHLLVKSFEGPQDVTGNTDSSERMSVARREWHRKHGHEVPFPELSSFEQTIMQDMIFPSQINASFDDIGGLDQTKRELFETVLLPLTHPHLYSNLTLSSSSSSNSLLNDNHSMLSPINSLLSAPTGVLFYGPPGCGKTIMAKAIAKNADCTFIQCNFATLISKYYGESEKFIASLFSVARKFAPAVIFIDEVDMYLGKRTTNDREQESRMKAQFLSLWDGLTTNQGSVLVLGATNRPFDLDEAILRRFSKQILFDLPSPQERLHILNVLLSGHVALESDDVLESVAMRTNGFSGSDLKELSKRAAMEAVREHIYKHQEKRREIAASMMGGNSSNSNNNGGTPLNQSTSMMMQSGTGSQHDDLGRPRATTRADFDLALKEIQPTGQQSMEYLRRFYNQPNGTPTRFAQGGSNSQSIPPLIAPNMAKGGSKKKSTTSTTGPKRSSGGSGGLSSHQPTQQQPKALDESDIFDGEDDLQSSSGQTQ